MTDQRMRRSTAVAQVEQMVAAADDIRHLAALDFDAPLVELWVGGAILEPIDRVATYDVALVLDEPPEELRGELAQCRRHLATVLDNYHDRDWRRDHTGVGVYPADRQWRAAQAVRELTDAVDDLERQAAEDT